MSDEAVYSLAARQHGLVHRRQVLEQLTRRQLDRRVDRGTLERMCRNVYRVGGAPRTELQSVLAACMSADDLAIASHLTAARLWGLELPHPARIEITVPSELRRRVRGVTTHETQVLGRRHTAHCNAIPVTSVARTLCDLTWPLPPWTVERAVDRALVRKLTSIGRLTTVFEDLATRGRRRSTVMRSIIEARGGEFQGADSVQEARVVRVLRGAGQPLPVQQHQLTIRDRLYFIDLAYPEQQIAIEYDGWDAHRSRSAFDRDRARQNDLASMDWTVLRFTSASSEADIVSTVATTLSSTRRSHTAEVA